MYTQCPDCSTAFRVTAEVLKQAAGKVRCGGCGVAFNALEYLSEEMPGQSAAQDSAQPLPELKPDNADDEKHTPTAISAEQSAALLKTLDELAGSDIRIEDTGVEWRVLDDDESAGEPDVGKAAAIQEVDELLDESPTPVDQFLTKTPNDIDAREIFEDPGNAAAGSSLDELRFDDNTPLPEDFDLDDDSPRKPDPARSVVSNVETETGSTPLSSHPRDADEAPGDIALGEPEEWADILGEFSEAPEPYVPPLDAELSALEEVLPKNAGNGAAGETPPDVDTQFALQAEAMGIDLSGLHTTSSDATAAHDLDESPDGDVVAEATEKSEDLEEPAQVVATGDDTELQLTDESGELPEPAAPGDPTAGGEDAELEVAAETGEQPEPLAPGDATASAEDDELEPAAETGERPEPAPPEDATASGDDFELELAAESGERAELTEAADAAESGNGGEPEPSVETGDDLEFDADPHEHPPSTDEQIAEEVTLEHSWDETDEVEGDEGNEAPLEFGSIEKAMQELEDQSDVFDKRFFEPQDAETAKGESELEPGDGALDAGPDDQDIQFDAETEESDSEFEAEALDSEFEAEALDSEAESGADTSHPLPPQSEEELTLNRLIDQELLSMAVEDEDGFASTIIVSEQEAEEAIADGGAQFTGEDTVAGFESIIMEGEFVQTALDQEKRKADIAAAALLAEEARLASEAEAREAGSGNRRGMIAAAVLLALLLVAQVLHQSREALATIPVFNDTVGPLYRAIGMPLSPAWDIRGFEFEATQRAPTDDEDPTRHTIYSRIGNASDGPLPYPLINITLTDRFEEAIGTRTLDPADYLIDNLDPSKLVRPGNTFNAIISIPAPAQGVTSYQLRLCYRLSDGKLRCKNSDFK